MGLAERWVWRKDGSGCGRLGSQSGMNPNFQAVYEDSKLDTLFHRIPERFNDGHGETSEAERWVWVRKIGEPIWHGPPFPGRVRGQQARHSLSSHSGAI